MSYASLENNRFHLQEIIKGYLMIEKWIRPKLQSIFIMPSLLMSRLATPNQITFCAFITGLLSAMSIASNQTLLALSLLWLSGLFDMLDGSVARLTAQKTAFGAFIDLISDRLVEAALILGFAYQAPENMWAYLFFLSALLFHFSTFVTAGALFQNTGNKSLHQEYSYIERAEAFIVFSFMMIFPSYAFWLLTLFSIGIMLVAAYILFK